MLLLLLACQGPDVPTKAVDADADGFTVAEDCDDAKASVSPEAPEYCNGVDDNCDGSVDEEPVDGSYWYPDQDGDGYGAGEGIAACAAQDGMSVQGGDCDDSRGGIYPGAQEVCDPENRDENCNGLADDADPSPDGLITRYADEDGDGFGNGSAPRSACDAENGEVEDASDCDDGAGSVHPEAEEFCNGVDDDCDGTVDEEAVDAPSWYLDEDGDGWGEVSVEVVDCGPPSGYVGTPGDCDDESAGTFPGSTEVCGTGDEDCDGMEDDADPSVDPGSYTSWHADADGDGYGDPTSLYASCEAPMGFVADAQDCSDQDPAIQPSASEICDPLLVDENCNGLADDADPSVDISSFSLWYADTDSDGYGDPSVSLALCHPPSGYLGDSRDCNDGNLAISPSAVELCDPSDTDENCNGLAEDADPSVDPSSFSLWYSDADGDGYGDLNLVTSRCDALPGEVADSRDCNDGNASISPGSLEVCDLNNSDEDCDGLTDDADPSVDPSTFSTWYADADGDGYGDASVPGYACDIPAGYRSNSSDCDDSSSSVHPGASDTCDGVDDNCDGTVDPSKASSCPDPSTLPLTEGGGLYAVDPSHYVLADENTWATSDAIITALERTLPVVTVGEVLADANRDGDPISSADLPRATGFAWGFVWNSGDVGVDYWIPQGITGSFDADSSGKVDGYSSVLVSWYYDATAGGTSYDKGVRISFSNISATSDPDYRFALLVKPTGSASSPSFEAVGVHAGGIAWVGDYLYVADTSYGIRVFDMTRILQVSTDTDTIGCNSAGTCRAYTYKYVIPQVTRYSLPNCGCDLSFSFVGYDSSNPSLITGTYNSASIEEVVVRWPLDPSTNLLAPYTTATEAYVGQQDRMQGAASYNGKWWLSCSGQSGAYGKLYRTTSSKSTGYTWVDGPEDLAVDPGNSYLWSLTEDVGDRWVFAVNQSKVGG